MNKEEKYDYLIVGSGLFGCVFAHEAKKRGYSCLIIEKRKHIGGNVYCDNIDGINIHKYGPHIFHTSNKEIWDYVNKFVDFNNYVNSPLAYCNGGLYHLPFNMNTFHEVWPEIITPIDAEKKILSEKVLFERITNLEEQAISMVGKTIYEMLIKGYTEKQWGKDCKDLPPEIIKRLPLRFSYNNNYFNDLYQGIPIGGYNKLIEGLVAGIEVICDTDYFNNRELWNSIANKIIYTGRIDEYYDYSLGKLDYRSVEWENIRYDTPNYQGTAVINYTTHEKNYTRIIEHKHFELLTESEINKIPFTIVSKEYSLKTGESDEPFYPINDKRNTELYLEYKKLAEKEKNVIFGGRLGEYKYYDMAPTIERALSYWK